MLELKSLLNEFLNYLEKQRGYSANTITSYRRDLTQYESFLKEDGLGTAVTTAFARDSIRGFLYSLSDSGLSPRTLSRKRASLLSLSKYAVKMNIIESNPLASIASPKLDKPVPVLLSGKQAEGLTEKLPDGELELRNLAIVELLYGTGIRLAELYELTPGDIDSEKQLIKVIGKGNKERIVPVTSYALKLIDRYLAARGGAGKSSPLFAGRNGDRLSKRQIQRVVEKELSAVTDAKKRSPHTLRHSYATHLLDNGADIRVVKELLGHASLASTQVYTHVTKDRLKNAFRQAHPRSGE